MKLLWSTELDYVTRSASYYEGKFVQGIDSVIYHFTQTFTPLLETKFTLDGKIIYSKSYAFEDERRAYPNSERYPTKPHVYGHLSNDSFTFGEYVVSHKGEFGYQCHKNGKLIWTKSLWAYLYTEIELIGENIVFGTAGHGGHFYSINLSSGETVIDINTKGTSLYYFDGEYFYIIVRNQKNSDLLKLSTTGEIVESVRMEGLYFDYECPFDKCDDRFYIVTLRQSRNGDLRPIINCISL